MPSLLQKAKEVSIKPRTKSRTYSKDEIDLILGWVHGDVTRTQIKKVLGFRSTSAVYSYIAVGLRQYLQVGKKAWKL